ncbi:MAG: hypothetical protein ABW352_13735 [Polyangiales bacterium]
MLVAGALYFAREQPAHAGTSLQAPLELAAQLVHSLRAPSPSQAIARRQPVSPSVKSAPTWRDDANPLSGNLGRNEAERKLFHDAEQSAIQDCMNERGFPYERAKYEEDAKREPGADEHLDYGLAKLLGERHEEPEAAPPSLEEQKRHDALLGKAEGPDDEDYAGVEADGYTLSWDTSSCVSEARRRVYGDEQGYRQLAFAIEALKFEAHELAEADDGFTNAVAGWKSCMQRANLPFDSRDQLVSSLAQRHERGELDGEQLAKEEREVAAIDERCDGEHKVGASMKSAFARTQKEVAERNSARLDAFAQLRETSLVRASAFLDE